MVANPLVTMRWLLVEGKFETEARILGMRLARARLLPSFVNITKSIFSYCFAHSFLRNDQVNKEKILL